MESANTTIVYKIKTVVKDIVEHRQQEYSHGVGKDAVFKEVFRGWFVLFEGSWERLYVGQTKPDLQVGDQIEIRISKCQA